jgi:DNA-binding beta-propeller fold protein YncE
MITLALATAVPLHAGTFSKTSIAPDLGVGSLTRSVAREQVNRDLFANPYATVTISHVDIYDRFPYLESREFQIVSDPRWNRLVFGERGRSLKAFDGRGDAIGALSEPRGLAVDENDRVYVADAANDRVVVFQASTEFGDMTLVPLFAIRGLHRPYDVAYSDGGTPFVAGDDRLYVADTGRNRIVGFALEASGARETGSLGELGSGAGRFAGPMAIAVGRTEQGNTADVYVADAHNRRIVQLRASGTGFEWVSERAHESDVVTSLDTDEWGNVYAAAPREGVVRKFNASLAPVALLGEGLAHPRSFHVPFANVRDHRAGSLTRVGQPNALAVEDWAAETGVSMWNLGVELNDLTVAGTDQPSARFTLTDRARITYELTDAMSGRSLARRTFGPLDAGVHSLPILPEDLRGATGGQYLLRVSAASSYSNGPTASAHAVFDLNGGVTMGIPSRAVLIGASPNPATSFARIGFLLPADPGGRVKLRVFDAQGRVVRELRSSFVPGWNEAVWDGTDEQGRNVRAGVYFCRLDAGEQSDSQRLLFVH